MIPNGVFRVELDVDSIIDKMREGRLRWFGHVKRRPQTTPVRRVEALIVECSRRKGTRGAIELGLAGSGGVDPEVEALNTEVARWERLLIECAHVKDEDDQCVVNEGEVMDCKGFTQTERTDCVITLPE
ncbi:hypothetical protein Tco_0071989 [Tanacetum coccineum]